MKQTLLRIFALSREDRQVLLLVAPLFLLVTASNVIVATFTKAVFLDTNSHDALPYMFLGPSLFTALASVAYVRLMDSIAMVSRFRALLGGAIVSFAALRIALPLAPSVISFVQLVWCVGIGHLIIIQSWNMASGLLPSRQAKRLFPVFAAIATLAAAGGGALVQVLVGGLHISANELTWVAVALLVWPLARISHVVRELEGAMPSDHLPADAAAKLKGSAKAAKAGESQIMRGLRSIKDSPLLLRLAGFVFFLQVASSLLDFQFSTELKAHYARDEIASFLGKYYGSANLLAFVFALVATGRIVRTVGIGVAVSAAAIVIGLGSVAYMIAPASGGPNLGWAFWIIVGTSFIERVASFALSRNAMQMLVTPIETRKGERAKTLIDGVIYRVATVLVSLALLGAQVDPSDLALLSPAAILACAAVVFMAWTIGPHYRRTLFEALRTRRLDASADPKLRQWIAETANKEVVRRLHADDPRAVLQSLEIVADLKLTLGQGELTPLLQHEDPEVVRRVLATMNDTGQLLEPALIAQVLERHDAPRLLREALRMMAGHQDVAHLEIVRPFARHNDAGVASLAVRWLKKVGGYKSTLDIEQAVIADIRSEVEERRARAVHLSSLFGDTAHAKADLRSMLEDPSPSVRFNAVEAMGQVASVEYIDPLIQCLGEGELTAKATESLVRFGPGVVDELEARLKGAQTGHATRVRLLHVLETIGGRDAVRVLQGAAISNETAIRNQAVLSLWRLARDPAQPRPDPTWVRTRALEELSRLERYMRVNELVWGKSRATQAFLDELSALRVGAETRMFRLLGLHYPRAAMYRAYLNYRSTMRRTRSNAIELLDQHVRDPQLRRFVEILEATDPQASATAAVAGTPLDADPQEVAQLLEGLEPWLGKVWQWANRPRMSGAWLVGGVVSKDPMDIVFLLKSVPLFQGLSGEQLLPVTDIVEQVTFDRGDTVFSEGDPGHHLYLVLEGTVEVLHSDDLIAVLGEKECFGEMALLDASTRSASIRVRDDVTLLAVSRDDFNDLLDLNPALAKGVIRVLTRRLRRTTEAVDNTGEHQAIGRSERDAA